MGRLLIVLGILSSIVAVIFLIVALGTAGDEMAGQIIAPFACEDGESLRLRTRSGPSFEGNGTTYTIDYFCVDAEDNQRDVTPTALLVIVIGFVSLLLTGIISFIIGVGIASKRFASKQMNTFLGGQSLNDLANQQSAVVDLRNGGFSQPTQATGDSNLTNRLQQLEEARQQGLISKAEYDRARQAILDSLDS